MVSFPNAVKIFFKRYTDFQGRSPRSEYWWVALFNAIVVFVLVFLASIMSGGDLAALESGSMPPGAMIPLGLLALYVLGILIPAIALGVRRFHDLGQTGWLVLVFFIAGLIPLVGILASLGQLVWFCMRGTVGPNKYGDDPIDNPYPI